ncbi:MAG: glycosyltransferase family 39 protein [Deltaproteobacteria bacterium]|nr:glycosyltransferase family 39 protein [Deltaproteobacteria bacterium]
MTRVLEHVRSAWHNDRAGLMLPLSIYAASLLVFVQALRWGLPVGDETWAADAIRPSAPLAVVYHNFLAEGWNSGWFWFKYPPFHAFLLTAAYLPYLLWAWVSGELHGFESQYPFGFADPELALSRLAWIGRLISALMGAGVVTLVYACVVRSFGRCKAAAAACATALCYPMVFYAQTTNVEVPYLFWMMVALLAAVRLLEGQDTRVWWMLLGVGAALSLSTKELVAGVFVGLPPAMIGVYLAQRRPAASWLRGGCAAALAFAAAIAVANNVFFNASGFTHRIGFLTQTLPPEIALRYAPYYFPIDLGTAHGAAAELDQLRMAGTRLLQSLGVPTSLLALAGVVIAMRAAPAWTALLLSIALAYYVVSVRAMLSLSLRYVMPLTLIATVFAGISLGTLLEGGTAARWRRPLAALLLLYLFAYGWDVNRMMKADGRYQAENWIAAHAADGARIEVYQNPTYLPRFPGRVNVDSVAFEQRTSEAFRERMPDFVVLSSAGLSGVSVQYKQDWHESGDTERGFVEGKKSAAGVVMTYQRQANVDFLAALADGSLGYHEAARFDVDPWIPRTLIQSLNPEILIYRRGAGAGVESKRE